MESSDLWWISPVASDDGRESIYNSGVIVISDNVEESTSESSPSLSSMAWILPAHSIHWVSSDMFRRVTIHYLKEVMCNSNHFHCFKRSVFWTVDKHSPMDLICHTRAILISFNVFRVFWRMGVWFLLCFFYCGSLCNCGNSPGEVPLLHLVFCKPELNIQVHSTIHLWSMLADKVGHRCGKICGFWVMGVTGMGMHLYCGVTGFHGYIILGWALFYCFKICFFSLFFSRFIRSHWDITKYSTASYAYILAAYHSTPSHSPSTSKNKVSYSSIY